VPVHGEMRHLAEHARFAVDNGIQKGVVQTNGTMLRLAPNGPALVGHEKVGRLILDGDVILPADGAALNERRRIAQNGIITVAIALNKQGGVVGEPGVTIQGMPVEEDRDDFIVEMRDAVLEATRNGQRDAARLNEKIRLSVRRAASDGQEAGGGCVGDPGLICLPLSLAGKGRCAEGPVSVRLRPLSPERRGGRKGRP
jgi:ribonuclease J